MRLATKKDDSVFLAVVTLQILWSLWFIYRSSFEINGDRVFCLFDDAMISMTYARNLVEGHGLIWARWGDPVEGFTCPLWTLLMVPVNLLPLALEWRSLPVQLIGLACLIANLHVIRRLMLAHFTFDNTGSWITAVVLTSVYYPLNFWTLMGMETGMQALLASLSIHWTLLIANGARGVALRLCVVLALALLLRMDMLFLVIVCLTTIVIRGGMRRSESKAWILGLLIVAISSGGYQLFRMHYFGDYLPNTYYLKMTGVPSMIRIARGVLVFFDFFQPICIPVIVAFIAVLPLLRRRPQYVPPVATVLLYFGYSIFVGGDVWEGTSVVANRFVAPFMPLLFVLINALLNEIEALSSRSLPARIRQPAYPYILWGLTAIGGVLFNGLLHHSQSSGVWRNLIVVSRPFLVKQHQEILEEVRRLQTITRSDAAVATVWAGIPSYFSDFGMVDMLGYNDRYLARMESVDRLERLEDAERYNPGHMKWDYGRLLGEQRPDVVFQVWKLSGRRLLDTMQAYGYEYRLGYWVRRDSKKVLTETSQRRMRSRQLERGVRSRYVRTKTLPPSTAQAVASTRPRLRLGG